MRDRMERFVLLPFTAGCISESSIAVGLQQAKRSKTDMGSTPTSATPFHRLAIFPLLYVYFILSAYLLFWLCEGTREGEKEEEDEEYDEDEESLSGENLKSPSTLLAIPKFQKLPSGYIMISKFPSSLCVCPLSASSVVSLHDIGLDGCASSILSKGWNNLTNPDMTNLPSFPSTPLQLAMAAHADNPTIRSLL